jgi:hypothetical protein
LFSNIVWDRANVKNLVLCMSSNLFLSISTTCRRN